MTYRETVEYLYNATPQFQSIGAAAYKPGLDTARELDSYFGHPHRHYPVIHIAGTNGKGSTAHTIASVLQGAGYKVGLYTSPHLVDFRERMRVNGEMITRETVVDFVDRYLKLKSATLYPSFFELTTIMAFDWMARERVDVAVIETGLGGRLDTTNIVTPMLSVITNISLDHTAQLGNTLEAIASEKAGIIKEGVPVVIGEWNDATRPVFELRAAEMGAPLYKAGELNAAMEAEFNLYPETRYGELTGELTGECQVKNAATILQALELLESRFNITPEAVREGFRHVAELTGLQGRWMRVASEPLTVADTGHNVGGWEYLAERLKAMPRPLTMVIGFVSDKDVDHIMPFMPRDAHYIFTRADIPRAMEASRVAEIAARNGLHGEMVESVGEAYRTARKNTPTEGSIFVGGSTFIVANLLGEVLCHNSPT